MSTKGYEIIWISWESHRRTNSIVKNLGVKLFEFSSKRNRIVKHPLFIFKTWSILTQYRPKVLIIQSPSIVLNFLAVFLKSIFRYKLVVDAHNAGVYSCDPRSDRIKWIYPFLQKRADLTIVTNEILADVVRDNGGSPGVLVDPLPVFTIQSPVPRDRKKVTFICSFAVDEPFLEVIEAAGLISPEITIHVTGNVEANRHLIHDDIPANINFTGFVPEEDFINLLATSSVVIDLTTWNDCLVCGGYESMAIGTPLILSDTPVNRSTFTRGALYCDNSAEGIAKAIEEALMNADKLEQESVIGKEKLTELFDLQLEALNLQSE